MRRSTASLPDCIGTCACLAIRGDSAIKPMNESLQSMGSTEEMRSFSRDVWSRTARTRSSSLGGREPRSTPPRAGPSHTWKSRPHRPKLIPEMTTSRYPASTNWFTCLNTSCGLRERLRPRTEGIMQQEQRLLHPSCTFKLGRVRSLPESKAGVASRCGPDESVLAELPLDGSTVGLGGAAAEIFYVKAGHQTILAYAHLR